MVEKKNVVLIIVGVIFVMFLLFITVTPTGVAFINNWGKSLKEADNKTNYDELKKVEDAARAMISTYNADKLAYEQYSKSTEAEKKSWSEQAKMRANNTASSYNNFILKNKNFWKDNVPADIFMQLAYIE